MPGGLVYHWKHGWIPLDHVAALQKAHGSKSGAAKVMARHGISAPHEAGGTSSTSSSGPSVARIHIEHTGDGTLVHGTQRGGPEVEALKANGFKYSSRLGSWYLPRNYGESTRQQKVYGLQKALEARGVDHRTTMEHARTTTAAERAAETQQRAAARAERLDNKASKLEAESKARLDRAHAISDMIPFGQPVLAGHHSQRRHERDLRTIHSNMDRGISASQEAESARQRAETARQTASGDESTGLIQRRIQRNEAEQRSIERTLGGTGFGTRGPASGDHKTRLEARHAELADQISFDRGKLDAAQAGGAKVFTKADISPGDLVKAHGSWHRVKRSNAKSVTVPSIVGGSWTDTIPHHHITEVRKGA